MERRAGRVGRPARVSRRLIAEAALEVGLSTLTLTSLANRLGVDHSTLYRHVASRDDIVAAHAEGTVQRLRPKLMTVTTMAAGLLPLLWADGPGAEIARRVAAPMIGGLASSAFLTLEVLPVLYTIWRHRQLRRAVRLGVPIQAVLGRIPPWAR